MFEFVHLSVLNVYWCVGYWIIHWLSAVRACVRVIRPDLHHVSEMSGSNAEA